MSAAVQATTAYVPPFAATTRSAIAAAGTAATTVSFASIGSLPGSTATRTASVAINTQGVVDSSSLLYYFTIPYIQAHTLSYPTWRYAYILWIVTIGTLVLWSIATHTVGKRGRGTLGAWFRKWSIRRITFGGKGSQRVQGSEGQEKRVRKRSWASPTIAQMLAVGGLVVMAVCLTVVGNDYIKPTTCTFGGDCSFNSGGTAPPRTTFGSKRGLSLNSPPSLDAFAAPPSPPQPESIGYKISKRQGGVNNVNGYAPFNDPLLAAPNYDIAFNSWTAAARLGLIAYAMLPLAITLALKQYPFNIWATPFLTNYHFDKTAILHRWSGRVIWAFSTAHVGAWTHQLFMDKDPFGRPVFVDVWAYWRFVAGAVAYVLLTIMVLSSLRPLRNRFYEFFYYSHILLVILFLAACVMHHKPVMGWAIGALALWGAERAVRLLAFLWINGLGKNLLAKRRTRSSGRSFEIVGAEKVERYSESIKDWQEPKSGGSYPPGRYEAGGDPSTLTSKAAKRSSYYAFGPGQDTAYLDQNHYPHLGHDSPALPSKSPFDPSTPQTPTLSRRSENPSPLSILPPPGFASAQLLPGRTIRLTLNTPRAIRWRPGQHLFLTIPAVALFQSHPYTILSIDERARGIIPFGGPSLLRTEGSEVVLLIRAQNGFSKKLWDYVVEKRRKMESEGAANAEVVKGVDLRALVSSPLGSAARADWESYETLLIVSGGTGITFGMAVLEYACRRMARSGAVVEGEKDDKFKTRRVRFVWILREFAHLSWVAPALRRCLEMAKTSQLQVDLFVSRDTRPTTRRQALATPALPFSPSLAFSPSPNDEFAPPTPAFARQGISASPSRDSLESDWSEAEDASPSLRRPLSEVEDHMDSVTDLILFEGEDDVPTPGEAIVSSKVRTEGKLRRALSRRAQGFKKTPSHRPTLHSHSSSASTDKFSERDLGLHPQPNRPSFPPLDQYPPPSVRPGPLYRTGTGASSYVDTGSFAELGLDDSESHSLAGSTSRRNLVGRTAQKEDKLDDDFFLDVTKEDQEDLDAVAELARPGYPQLDKIMEEEVQRSAGRTMVACCGPTELNTLVRNLVSSKIDLGKVARGDPRGQVSLVCEDFSF